MVGEHFLRRGTLLILFLVIIAAMGANAAGQIASVVAGAVLLALMSTAALGQARSDATLRRVVVADL